ncbi:MAG: HD domain-containing phosphohydrolase, partial [Endomicrobiia bacterium]
SKDPRFTGKVDLQSGFKTRSILAVPMLITGQENNIEVIGVLEVLNKKNNQEYNEEDKKLIESLAGLASVTISNAKFSENQRNFFTNITEIMVSAIENFKSKSAGIYWKIAQTATMIAKMLNIDTKSEEYKTIYFGSLLHDIGYLSSKLKSEIETANILERNKIEQKHTLIGAEIVEKINLLKNISPIVKYHHENYDGSGYPEGLKGEQIPLSARILAVAEYVEELKINNLSKEEIIKLLQQYSGTKFDPEIVKIVTNILSSE